MTSRRWRAAGRAAAKGAALLLLFVAALVLSVIVHLNLATVRNAIAAGVTAKLAPLLRGRIAIERVGHIGPLGVSGARVRIRDPKGRQVALADGVAARLSYVHLVRSLLVGGVLDIDISLAAMDHVDLSLDTDESGKPALLGALTPGNRKAPKHHEPEETSAGVRLTVRDIWLWHAWIHGRFGGLPHLDADLRDMGGFLAVHGGLVDVAVHGGDVLGRGMPFGANPHGRVEGRLNLPSLTGSELWLDGRFDGDVGGVRTALTATLDGDKLITEIDASADPGSSRTLVPELPVQAPILVHLDGEGTLPNVGFRAETRFGRGVLDLDGTFGLSEPVGGSARFRARDVDLRDVWAGTPTSTVAAVGDVSLSFRRGRPHGTFRIRTEPGRVDTEVIPSIAAAGRFSQSDARARALLDEPGAPISADLEMHPSARGMVLGVEASSTIADLMRVPRLGPLSHGRTQLNAKGELELSSLSLRAQVHGRADGVSRDRLRVPTSSFEARLEGPLAAPSVRAAVHAPSIVFRTQAFKKLSVQALGTTKQMVVAASLDGDRNVPNFSAGTSIDFEHGVTLRDASAVFGTGGDAIVIGADMVRLRAEEVRVVRAVVIGAGAPLKADVDLTRSESRLVASSPDFDVGRVVQMLDGKRAIAGHVAFDADVVGHGGRATGKLRADLRKGSFGRITDAAAHLEADFLGDRVEGIFRGSASPGTLDVHARDVHLGGAPIALQSWRDAYGDADISVQADLARLRALIPNEQVPFGDLSGSVVLGATVTRKSASEIPALSALSAKTDGLTVSGSVIEPKRTDPALTPRAPPWRYTGIDLKLDVASRDSRTEATCALHDQHGALAEMTASWVAPDRDVLGEGGKGVADWLRTVPFDARLKVPKRRFADLPWPLGGPSIAGELELDVSASQTFEEPKFSVVGRVRDFDATRGHLRTGSVGLDIDANYDGRDGTMKVVATSEGQEAFTLDSRLHGQLSDVLGRGNASWDASAHVKVASFPVGILPVLADQRIRGTVSGGLDVDLGSKQSPHANGHVESDDLAVGYAANNRARVQFDLNGDALDGSAKIDQSDGSAEAKITAGLDWSGSDRTPKIAGPIRLSFAAHHFRSAVLLPLVQNFVREMDGRVDGNARIEMNDPTRIATMQGSIQLREGVVQFPSFGDQFRGAKADIHLEAKGDHGVIRADGVTAESVNGKVKGSVIVQTNGLEFAEGHATMQVPENDSLPIVIEGQSFAHVWGTVRADAVKSPNPGQIDVKVTVPVAGARLVERSAHALQDLSRAERLRIGTFTQLGDFIALPMGQPREEESASKTSAVVSVHVQDMELRRGSDLRVRVEGDPVVHTVDQVRVFGVIRMRGGYLEAEGKRFEVQRGTVTFNGDPENPLVVVTAGWKAPEGTQVYADFVGPLKTGKVTLRSDPPHTNSEILSLILFGSPAGSGSSAYGAGTTAVGAGAAGVAGLGAGAATQGLNRAIDNLTGLDVTTRIDTTDSANPRPEVEVRIARDISIAVAHVLGVPAPGMNPDRNLATFAWRFSRNWSLDTTVGDQGSTIVDLVWQYRY